MPDKKLNDQFHDNMKEVAVKAYEDGRKVMDALRTCQDYALKRSLVETTYFDLVKIARRFGHLCPPFGRPQGIDVPPVPKATPPPRPEPREDPARQVIADNADEDPKADVEEYKAKRRKSSRKKTKK